MKNNIIIRKEGEYYVTRVLENNISSFGTTEDEALKNTYEAIQLYYEDEENARILKNYVISHPSLIEYELNA